MRAEDQGAKDGKKARRRRKGHTIGRIVCLISAGIFVPFFVTAIWIGYLSWIGILVGIVYLAPGILSPLAGLTAGSDLRAFSPGSHGYAHPSGSGGGSRGHLASGRWQTVEALPVR
jgi:hypothetical protein